MKETGEDYHQILGIRFFTGTASGAVALALRGGLVVVPSAPVLVGAAEESATQAALLDNDLAITDSGLMILVWSLLHRKRLRRVSGLEYLKLLLEEPVVRAPGATLWVMPGEGSMEHNVAWLQRQGHGVTREDCYIAPQYPAGVLVDRALLDLIETRKPAHVVMAVGGGVQERLGHYLKRNLSYRPGIHCTGAAIGFLSGEQVNIPVWADYFYLGWLFRCVQSPWRFIPRYWKAARLVPMMIRWGARAPRVVGC
jgi:UDP-N-acetyl-D-mannosaminuronic acid transferase (WecB/TagA/CpsF family)